jgi:glutathione synthase
MRHLILIDPLEKLNVRKDSSLMLALALKARGIETYVFFEKDFSIHNQGVQKLKVFSFEGEKEDNHIYLKSFETLSSKEIDLNHADTVHMRLDPPFDGRYLRILWMLDYWVSLGVNVLNDPKGIMLFNEKLYAYSSEGSTPSYIGQSLDLAKTFVRSLDPAAESIILKPMDLYSGIGVEKLAPEDWEKRFLEKVSELNGPIIVQPYVAAVTKGEIRSLYFKQKEIGTILKIPKQGAFLSNIAQGATFKKENLSPISRARCEKIVEELARHGVDWVAFDILGDAISEVNITCPGLLVEVSYAYGKNLADEIIELMLN